MASTGKDGLDGGVEELAAVASDGSVGLSSIPPFQMRGGGGGIRFVCHLATLCFARVNSLACIKRMLYQGSRGREIGSFWNYAIEGKRFYAVEGLS